VYYECLLKPRTQQTQAGVELQRRLRAELSTNAITSYHLDVGDLQDLAVLENRKRLGKGELSSIVFAKKTQQALLTDDQKARRLATQVMLTQMVQTTPHLLGWLFFTDTLSDGDKDPIIREHEAFGRPLARYFEEMYIEALRCRLMASASRQADSSAL